MFSFGRDDFKNPPGGADTEKHRYRKNLSGFLLLCGKKKTAKQQEVQKITMKDCFYYFVDVINFKNALIK